MNISLKRSPCALSCCMLLLILGLWQLSPARAQEPTAPSDLAAQRDPTADESTTAAWIAWDALPVEIQAKVDPRILAELRGEDRLAMAAANLSDHPQTPTAEPIDKSRFLVFLTTQPDLTALDQRVYASAADRRAAVVDELRSTAVQSQAALKALLADRQRRSRVVGYQPFYIVNAIAVEGDLDTIVELAQRDEVERIAANYPLVRLWDQATLAASAASDPSPTEPPAAYPWNITLVGADRVWHDLGITGEGAVVGGFDSGVNYQHPALNRSYRGLGDDGLYAHNYNWFEPGTELYANGNLGPSRSRTPYDCDYYNTHGTHTMGTMVGNGGTPETSVGVAPGARWIAIPGICAETMPGFGLSDDIGGLKAFQWFLCPTDLSGDLATADCSLAPDVINNSWGTSNPVNDLFRPAIAALRAAGITVVFSAGNTGRDGSIGSPAHLPEAITVGATTSLDELAYFSSRGPAFQSLELKPNVSAPGDTVRSSVGLGGYSSYSGTSMAAPHVAGLIALLVSADLADGERNLNVDELEAFVTNTVVDLGISGPDVEYGHGRMDGYQAVRWALSSGDLRGQIRDGQSHAPIDSAHLRGHDLSTGEHFSGVSISGLYSLTVPAGLYHLTIDAWGYDTATFANQRVIAGALSIANLDLQPLPSHLLTGTLRRASTPVVDARVYIQEHPSTRTTSAVDGSFALNLPPGQHTLVIEASGHRRVVQTVTVMADLAVPLIRLEAAPSILLVNADASAGWFYGWPVHPFIAWALDQYGFLYDLWSIDYTHFIDQRALPNGDVEYGIPSAQTLLGYDVVIWMHSGCSSYYTCGNPYAIHADGELSAYLEAGGRLLISGQDLGWMDGDDGFFDRYLRADILSAEWPQEGLPLTGRAFLDGITLNLTNASLYGSPNSAADFSPDRVTPARSGVYPVLTYADGGTAALAVDPCDANYKALYMAMGYENVAPRADWQNAAISDLVARSVRWLSIDQPSLDYQLSPQSVEQIGESGQTLIYQVKVENAGTQPVKVVLALTGNQWSPQILEDGTPIQAPVTIPPCSARQVQIMVQIPADAVNGQQETFTLTASTPDHPALTPRTQTFTARVLPLWQSAAPIPNQRLWMATATMPDTYHFYTVGGDSEWEQAAANQRYDGCTDTWEILAPLPQGLVGASAAGIDGKLYVAGGQEPSTYPYTFISALYIYDPATDSWSRGADLPNAQGDAASAVVDGKLYLIGGKEHHFNRLDHVLIYDPVRNEWSAGAPIPGGFLSSNSATVLNGEIYILGDGWSSMALLIYNPATDSWRAGTPPMTNRYDPVLVGASDGYLYLFGGFSYPLPDNKRVDRYSPSTDSWEIFSSLRRDMGLGASGGFVAGKLLVVGDFLTQDAELLKLTPTFCDSDVAIPEPAVESGDEFPVRVTLQPEFYDLPNARLIAPIPSGATFGAFVENALGASYNEATRQVEWQGALSGGSASRVLAYTLRADAALQSGARIQDQVIFDTGLGVQFTRDLRAGVYRAEFSASAKRASANSLGSGDRLTYTIDLLSRTPVGAPLLLHDTLPVGLRYLPGSLSASTGAASYDSATRTIHWQGDVQPRPGTTLNLTDDYLWGDSLHDGDVTNVTFAWTDITKDGKRIALGDDQFICDLDLGFPFPFYGETYSRFCLHTDGYITFGPIDEPMPWACTLLAFDRRSPLIAGLWHYLNVKGEVYAKVTGSAPNRQLILQWEQEPLYWTGVLPIVYQIVLTENGDIQIHVLSMPLTNFAFVVGVQDGDARSTTAYNCNKTGGLSDRLAVRFLAPGQSAEMPRAQVHYGVELTPGIALNTWITNSVWITSTHVVYDRHVSVLANPLDLGGSTLTASKPEVKVNEPFAYFFRLRNSGVVTASGASLINALPPTLAYLPDSLTCSAGNCGVASQIITWTGDIPAQEAVTVIYSVTLTSAVADRVPITNSAQLHDGLGQVSTLSASVLARQSELSASFVEIDPVVFHPGDVVNYTLFLFNSGGDSAVVEVSHALPAALTYEDDSLFCVEGQCRFAAGTIQWQGSLPPRTLIPVRFRATVSPEIAHGSAIVSLIAIQDQTTQAETTIRASFDVAHQLFLADVRAEMRRLYLPQLEQREDEEGRE